ISVLTVLNSGISFKSKVDALSVLNPVIISMAKLDNEGIFNSSPSELLNCGISAPNIKRYIFVNLSDWIIRSRLFDWKYTCILGVVIITAIAKTTIKETRVISKRFVPLFFLSLFIIIYHLNRFYESGKINRTIISAQQNIKI